MRFGNPVHVFNNCYNNSGYGVASTMNAGGRVQPIPYGYSLGSASFVKSVLTGGAGVGHLNL